MRILIPTTFAALTLAGCVGQKKYDALAADLADAREHTAMLQSRLGEEQAEVAEISADKRQLQRALEAQRNRRDLAEARVASYEDLVERFAEMIDAGTLAVKIVDGRMVVELGTDILFPSGSAQLSKDGADVLVQVANVLGTFDERQFQIEGHTDDDPIHTAQYPSNWHLGSARAITVVNTLVENGMSEGTVSAASFADNRPTAPNATEDGQAQNRRIEIVLLPDLSTLPGFEELNRMASN